MGIAEVSFFTLLTRRCGATFLLLLVFPLDCWSLECYVCTNQENNDDKCIKTIKTCEILENRCLSEIRWGSTPYWDSSGKKQFYISKSCAREDQCKERIQGYSKRCDRIWYNDWECAECCYGDRCNYYVTLSGNSMQPHTAFLVFLICGWLLLWV